MGESKLHSYDIKVVGADTPLTAREELVIGLTDATYRALVKTSALAVPDAQIPELLLSVTASLTIKVCGLLMAHPALTESVCEWVQDFAKELPAASARAATINEVKM